MLKALHTRVAGRARLRVKGLAGSPELALFLETRLVADRIVLRASASVLTGNLLVFFDTRWHVQTVIEAIEALLAPDSTAGTDTTTALPAAKTLRSFQPPHLPCSLADLPEAKWHTRHVEEIAAALSTDASAGLEPEEARRRLVRDGPNRIPEPLPRSGWEMFFGQLCSLPVYLLGAAAGVSLLTGGIIDAVVIAGVVVANAVIGDLVESRADATIRSLKTIVEPLADVIRGNQAVRISPEHVVTGDVIVLKPGTYVPADCRITSASYLSIDESMLTGESLPAGKSALTLTDGNLPLPDRANMAYMGTLVTGGAGLAIVVAIGAATQLGCLQLLLDTTEAPLTPIERQLARMGDQLVMMCAIICLLVFVIGLLRGYGLVQMLRSAISLAAAAVPEGLPAAATINFALGVTGMRRHKVLVRQLQAVETLGALQTICLDKTGTITHNRMTVESIHVGRNRIDRSNGRFVGCGGTGDILGQPEGRHLLEVCALCNETRIDGKPGNGAFRLRGSATENALVQLAVDAGMDVDALRRNHPCLEVNHRSENRLFMSTLHPWTDQSRRLLVKGSPPEVLSLCNRWMVDGAVVGLTAQDRRHIESANEAMTGRALRVLAAAFAPADGTDPMCDKETMVWLGLVGMADPVRPGVAELIGQFHRAGIETVMITGDQGNTAFAVAREINISGSRPLKILDAVDLTALGPGALKALASKAHVYARVSPSDKLRIVQALQSANKIVAMTGDGINDGPALKAADIGIAMGRSGTDVAREVADVVLQEDHLDVLITAVRDGRGIYSNIGKTVHYFLSTNMTEITVMFTAMALGLGFPLNVMQLLWINLISDILPGLALSMEPPEPDIMSRPPRDADAPLFCFGDYKRMAAESATISLGALAAFAIGLMRYGTGSAGAGAMAFQSLTFGQLLHVFNCRKKGGHPWEGAKDQTNFWLWAAVGVSLALQALTMVVPPLRRLLGLGRLGVADAAVIAGCALIPFFVNDVTKTNKGKRP